MPVVDVVLFGDCVNFSLKHKVAVDQTHGKEFNFTVKDVLVVITALRSLHDIQSFVCDTSIAVDFAKKVEFEMVLKTMKQCLLSGKVGCAVSRIHNVKESEAKRLAFLLSEDHNYGKILQAAINKKANYGRIATMILSCKLIESTSQASAAPPIMSMIQAPFNITAFQSKPFNEKTCKATCGAISKCIKHLMGEIWKVGGRYVLYGLSAGTEPIRLLTVFASEDEEATYDALDWSHEVSSVLSRDPFFANFVRLPDQTLRTDEGEVFYYVMCVFGMELISLAGKETESIFRMMSVKVEKQKTLFFNPYFARIGAQYETLLVEVFGKARNIITSDKWELKCLDSTIGGTTIMSEICRLRQLLLQLYYMDLVAKDEIQATGQYALINGLSAPTYFATEEAALDAGFALELYPPVFFVTLAGAPSKLYSIPVKSALFDDDLLILHGLSTQSVEHDDMPFFTKHVTMGSTIRRPGAVAFDTGNME